MTVVGRSLFHSTLVRICKEIRSWYMSPLQIGLVRIFVKIFVRIFKRLLNQEHHVSSGKVPFSQ